MADSLWKSFGKHHVLRDFSVVLRAGSVSVLIGANGAGKSTLMRILAGLLAPDSGTVWAECSVGYSPQAPSLNDYLTPVEHVRLFGTAAGMSQEVASRAGARLAECLGWDLAKESVCGSLSGGTRQKLNVVLAGLHTPEVILLDEPHQGLDYESSAMLWDLIAAWRDQGKHVLVASHIREAIVHADTVIEVPRLSKE
ncbi:MAG: ATP-binding cassette domain-containing protein [Actinobacteria bacterium]|nr:ATP-binding cassette domain-containing protein [Actinomycetota bacterium]